MQQEKKTPKGKKLENGQDSKFNELFLDQIKDIYWAENQLLKAIPKMEKAATTDELAHAFNEHYHETQGQVKRLEQIFEMLEKKPAGKKCEAMAGLIAEAEELMDDTEKDSMVRDAALIMAAQKVEHYEMATYGSLRTLATKLQFDNAAELLEQTLSEEKNADDTLTEIAESQVNEEASEE